MPVKAIEIIQSAVEELGEYAPGETMTDADAQRGLAVLNDILDGWSNEPQACFAFRTITFPMVINQTSYTIGPFPAADINDQRPLKIVQAFMTDTLSNNYGISILNNYEWNQITNKIINGQVPSALYYDSQDPIATIYIWPAPILVWNINIVSHLQLTAFANLYDDVILPRGYVPALKYTLAVELAPFFGAKPQDITIAKAMKYLADLKRTNYQDNPATFDPEIRSNYGRSYNIHSDTNSGPRGSY